MTGLEKMISQIAEEAKSTAQSMVAEATAQAEQMVSEAKAEADKISEAIFRQSETDTKNHLERIHSSADLQRRTAILQAKQEVIASVLEKAYASLNDMETEAYFELIKKILGKYALPEAGNIYFSAADLKRLPAGFEKEISKIAAGKGGSLTLQKDSKDIENGCILVYGGIEENCTFRALFNARKDRLQDVANRELFA
ncbi:MAG: hypothetical protein IJ036_03415 [Lachnospiraceae bacterium]|nr:hypothetical protein [Lachnospiraceae bacterium]